MQLLVSEQKQQNLISAIKIVKHTGGPPLTQKSLTRFPLPQFLAYVRVSGGISVSRGPQYSPTNTNFMYTVFFKSENACKAGTLCTCCLQPSNSLIVSSGYIRFEIRNNKLSYHYLNIKRCRPPPHSLEHLDHPLITHSYFCMENNGSFSLDTVNVTLREYKAPI